MMNQIINKRCFVLIALFTIHFFISVSPVKAQGTPKIGLVLGGGGAKGAAEAGALQIIDELGIRPDIVVGTSIGAIVGGLYAAGYSGKEISDLFCQQEWLSLLTDRRDDLSYEPYKQEQGTSYVFGFPVIDINNATQIGMLKGQRVEQVIDSLLAVKGCTRFECLPVSFKCIAAELIQAKEVELHEGSLSRAIRASMAIPGIFKPVKLNGRQLYDGGMMNNLPVDVARRMGADIVIAIDLQQDSPSEPLLKVDDIVVDIADIFGLGGITNWVFSRPDIAKWRANSKDADIYINPQLPNMDATSFGNNKMRRMIQAGKYAARQKVDEMLQLKPRWPHIHIGQPSR